MKVLSKPSQKRIIRNKHVERNRFFRINLFLVFFLAFSGYYVGLMIVSNLASTSLSRYFTIPVRLVILIGLYFLYKRSKQHHRTPGFYAFLIFAGFYLIRIGTEIVFGLHEFYMPKSEFLLYFLAFVLAPFVFISKTYLNHKDLHAVLKYILLSCLLLSATTYYFYGNLLGQVSRISQEIKHDENYISPLALSYCGSLGIGIGSAFILTNKITKKGTITFGSIILSCFVPFFLGASRGSILALVIPFIIFFYYSKGINRKIKLLLTAIIGIISLIFATRYFGTGIFDRFFSIGDDITSGNSSAVRLSIWKADLQQFMDNPLFGNSLESQFAHHYSHNILIEILITTGVMGLIPFIIFLYFIFRKTIRIIRHSPENYWITVIFIQALVQYMFSGAIWGMSWVAIGAGLVLGFSIKNTK